VDRVAVEADRVAVRVEDPVLADLVAADLVLEDLVAADLVAAGLVAAGAVLLVLAVQVLAATRAGQEADRAGAVGAPVLTFHS